MNHEPVLSVHVPKAGGSSLLTQFQALLGDDMATDYARAPLSGREAGSGVFPPGKRLLHGHFNPMRYASARACWVTFLREPVENLISIWCYWHALPPIGSPLHDRFLAERPGIEDFAREPGIRHHMSRNYFGGVNMRRFAFVGFHESRHEDIPRLGRLLGLPLSAEVHENRTREHPQRGAMLADTRLRRRLADTLLEDVRFYERQRNAATRG